MKSVFRSLILKLLWAGVRRKVAAERPYVITISGSVGKTSSKEAIADVLSQSGRPVVRTHGNLGTDTGVPLSLLGFHEPPDGGFEWLTAIWLSLFPPVKKYDKTPYYVLEYSADKPGDIAYLAEKIPFQACVLTRIVPTHMAYYPDFATLVAEETSLVPYMRPGGYLVANADDPSQAEAAGGVSDVCWYGIPEGASKKPGVWAHGLEVTDSGMTCTIDFVISPRLDNIAKRPPHRMEVKLTVLGRQQVYPLLAAAAVGFKEGVPFEMIKAGLEAYVVPPGRGRIIPGHKEIVIVDDSYNAASPDSVKDGLDMIRNMKSSRRKVAILGRMNELGGIAEGRHIEVGKHAAGCVDFLVSVGQYAETMAEAAKKAGMPSVKIISFSTTEQLLDKLEQVVQAKDLVYVKGSQNGVRLERVTKSLMVNPEDAEKLLVRQSSYWKARS